MRLAPEPDERELNFFLSFRSRRMDPENSGDWSRGGAPTMVMTLYTSLSGGQYIVTDNHGWACPMGTSAGRGFTLESGRRWGEIEGSDNQVSSRCLLWPSAVLYAGASRTGYSGFVVLNRPDRLKDLITFPGRTALRIGDAVKKNSHDGTGSWVTLPHFEGSDTPPSTSRGIADLAVGCW